ncbi:MAG: type VI secretion system Vgr family protein [Rhodothalassiaceae bacterium]
MDAVAVESLALTLDVSSAPGSPPPLSLIGLDGTEEISRPYSFRLSFTADDHGLNPDDLLKGLHRARITRNGHPRDFWGYFSSIAMVGVLHQDRLLYEGVLESPIWLLSLSRRNLVYQQVDIREILDQRLAVLQTAGVEVEYRLTGSYPTHEYVVQYEETDLDFISRRMEHHGICYFFESDPNKPRLVVSDDNVGFRPAGGSEAGARLPLRMTPSLNPLSADCVTRFRIEHRRTTAQVRLMDYNYRRPTLDVTGEAAMPDPGDAPPEAIEYGSHQLDDQEGNTLAQLRMEEQAAQAQLIHGDSNCVGLSAGSYLILEAGPDLSALSGDYALIRVEHRAAVQIDGAAGYADGRPLGYAAQFSGIPKAVPFRPERSTPKPRVHGLMHARIDSANGTTYADLTDKGEYRIVNMFDTAGAPAGAASRTVRMAQPYLGQQFGMHFPLHKDTEVVWAAIDGDPDRPIILGAVPNPQTGTPVVQDNQTQCVLKSCSNNSIIWENEKGAERFDIHAQKDQNTKVLNNRTEEIDVDHRETIGNNHSQSVGTDKTITVGNNHSEEIGNNMTLTVGADRDSSIEKNDRLSVTEDRVVSVGKNASVSVKDNQDLSVGKNRTETTGKTWSSSAKDIVLEAQDSFTVKVGKATLTLKKDGTATLNGKTITIKGSGDVVLKGKAVKEN